MKKTSPRLVSVAERQFISGGETSGGSGINGAAQKGYATRANDDGTGK